MVMWASHLDHWDDFQLQHERPGTELGRKNFDDAEPLAEAWVASQGKKQLTSRCSGLVLMKRVEGWVVVQGGSLLDYV